MCHYTHFTTEERELSRFQCPCNCTDIEQVAFIGEPRIPQEQQSRRYIFRTSR